MLPKKDAKRVVIDSDLSNQKRTDLGDKFAKLQRELNKTFLRFI